MPLQRLVRIGVLGALGWVLMYFAAFKLPIFPAFLQVDPGDMPALLAVFTMGTGAGLWTEVVKVLVHFLLRGGNVLGHAANLLAGASFILGAGLVYRRGAGLVYRRGDGRWRLVAAAAAGAAAVALVMIPANALVFLPARGITGDSAWTMAVQVLAPFNLFKFGLSGVLACALSARLLPWLAPGAALGAAPLSGRPPAASPRSAARN